MIIRARHPGRHSKTSSAGSKRTARPLSQQTCRLRSSDALPVGARPGRRLSSSFNSVSYAGLRFLPSSQRANELATSASISKREAETFQAPTTSAHAGLRPITHETRTVATRLYQDRSRPFRANPKLQPAEITTLVEAYHGGASIKALGRRFKLHEQTVWAHLERAGVELRPQKCSASARSARSLSCTAQGNLASNAESYVSFSVWARVASRRVTLPDVSLDNSQKNWISGLFHEAE
ncbi:MAG: hypothetical protein QOE23_690 [Pseudonocardiales bacterium]|nr:hypothetical protein [Pseudonocardiales bacterium]